MKPRSARLASGRPGAAGVVVVACCLALFLPALTGNAQGQCLQGAVTCANNAAMRTCMATLMCSDAATQMWAIGLTMNLNVTMCSPLFPLTVTGMTVTIPLTAMALMTAPTARYCDWYWYRQPFPPSPPNFGFATISTTQGLPVELMEFSVESGDESADGEDRETAAE